MKKFYLAPEMNETKLAEDIIMTSGLIYDPSTGAEIGGGAGEAGGLADSKEVSFSFWG